MQCFSQDIQTEKTGYPIQCQKHNIPNKNNSIAKYNICCKIITAQHRNKHNSQPKQKKNHPIQYVNYEKR